MLKPCIQKPKTSCNPPMCILFSFWSKNVCIIYSTFSCGSTCICAEVSQLNSMQGKNRDDYSPDKQKEEKTNIGNTAMNRTLLDLKLSCPTGTSGIVVTPRVTEWSLTLQQLFIKADRLERHRRGSISDHYMRPWTVLVQPKGPLVRTGPLYVFFITWPQVVQHSSALLIVMWGENKT